MNLYNSIAFDYTSFQKSIITKMNPISSTKISFYFRSETSVKNAILKIKNLLISINNNSINSPTIESMKHEKENKGIILTLYNPKLEITFYKKEINILNKSAPVIGESQGENDFSLSLKSMEEDLYKSFTEIRMNNSSPSLNKRKTSQDIKEVIDIKGYSKTDVFLSLSYDDGEPVIIQPSLDSYIDGSIRNIKETISNTKETIPNIKFDEKIVETKPVGSSDTGEEPVKRRKVKAKPIIKNNQKNIESKTNTFLPRIFLGSGYKFSTGRPADVVRAGINSWFNKFSLPKFSNIFNYLPNRFVSSIKQIVLTTSDLLSRGIVFIYLTICTLFIFITGINFLTIFTQWLPFIHHVNVNLLSLGNIYDNIVNSFKYINSDVLTESFINNIEAPISENTPDNEVKPLNMGTITEFVKDVMSNTVITLSDNMSTTIDTPRENSSVVNKTDTLIINEDETKEDNSGFFNVIQKVFYVAIAFVAIDLLTGFPSNITFNDPEIISYLGDFIGGLVSMGLVTISTILQILFGDSDNDKDNSKKSSKPEKLFFNQRPDNDAKYSIEYKNSGDNKPIKFITDKVDSIGKTIQINTNAIISSHLERCAQGESSNNHRADTILGFNNNSINNISTNSEKLIEDLSNIKEKVMDKGGKLIKDVSDSGERFINNASNNGQKVLTKISNSGEQLINNITDTTKQNSRVSLSGSYTNPGFNDHKLISPWGASFTDPTYKGESSKNNFMESTIKFLKREGDKTFTNNPNTGPLETNLRDSDIPIIQLNSRRLDLSDPALGLDHPRGDPNMYNPSVLDSIDEETVLEELVSKRNSNPQLYHPTEEIVIINNVVNNDLNLSSRISELEESIIHSTTNINSETKDQIRSLIHYYGNEIKMLYEIVGQKDSHLEMKEDVLIFQENEIEVLKTNEIQQEYIIHDQTTNLLQNEIALNHQEEIINDQVETIKNQSQMLRKQTNKIEELRKAINQCETALYSLTSSIENTNGESLLNEDDKKQLIRSLITGSSSEEIKPRFEELKPSSRDAPLAGARNIRFNIDESNNDEIIPLQPMDKGKAKLILYNGFEDNNIPRIPYITDSSNNIDNSNNSTFKSYLPVRSSSLKK